MTDLTKKFFLGWSWHKGIPACGNSHLSMTFNTAYDEGLLVYAGPSPNNIVKNVTDFLSIELKKGKLTMLVNFGSKPKLLNLNQRVDDSKGNEFIIFTGPVERFWSYMDSTFMLILKPPGLHLISLFKVTKV